jgi:signal transduction histidine kinase
MRRVALWPTVIGAGTVLVLVLFLLIVLRNVDEMRVLSDQTFQIEHTLEVQRQLDALLIAEAEGDASVRAYVLTGSEASLEQFRAAARTVSERLNRLSELTADDPYQQQRIASIRQAIGTRASRLEQVVSVRKQTGTAAAAISEARASDSSGVRPDIRRIIAEMESEESRLLQLRRDQAARAYRQAVSGRVGSGIVSAALLVGIVVFAGLHARSKARREQALVASERRALESAAREQEARAVAERANRDKDEFLAVLSHELRTPLNAVLGWTQILQASGPTEPTLVRALASIRRNAEAQQRLVEDLLDVSRIIAGKLPFERQAVDLRVCIGAALDTIRPAAASKAVALSANMSDTAPVVGDAGRLQQVAGNLLSNAVKFTASGGHITVTLRDDRDAALLEVADNGIGVPPDLLPHIFDRFRQGDASTTREHGGLGLGLAIAKHIVDAHGGSITAESAGLGAGATFRVRVPYA